MGSFPENLMDPIEQQGISFDSNFPFVLTKEAGGHAPSSCDKCPVHGTSTLQFTAQEYFLTSIYTSFLITAVGDNQVFTC